MCFLSYIRTWAWHVLLHQADFTQERNILILDWSPLVSCLLGFFIHCQVCKFKFRLRELTSCLCFAVALAVSFEGSLNLHLSLQACLLDILTTKCESTLREPAANAGEPNEPMISLMRLTPAASSGQPFILGGWGLGVATLEWNSGIFYSKST